VSLVKLVTRINKVTSKAQTDRLVQLFTLVSTLMARWFIQVANLVAGQKPGKIVLPTGKL